MLFQGNFCFSNFVLLVPNENHGSLRCFTIFENPISLISTRIFARVVNILCRKDREKLSEKTCYGLNFS
jgi:hypothetical protein